MRILVLGAGGIGGYFGGRIHAAGGDVTFLVRPLRAAQLRQNGLQVHSPHGDLRINPQVVTSDELRAAYLAPAIAGASIAVLDLLESPAGTTLRDRLHANTAYFRQAIAAVGFEIKPGDHPIVPIMVYDAVQAQRLAARLLELGVYVVGFFFPVVPRGQARIRVQLSAAHSRVQLEAAVAAFTQAGRELGLVQ